MQLFEVIAVSAYDGMTDRDVAHAVLAFLRLGYRNPRGGPVARGPSPYLIRGGDGLTASSALLDETKALPLVFVEAIAPQFTDESLSAAVNRVQQLLALTSRTSFGRAPIPEVWLCVPAPSIEHARARHPDVGAKWVPYQL